MTLELRPGFVWENGGWRRETPDDIRNQIQLKSGETGGDSGASGDAASGGSGDGTSGDSDPDDRSGDSVDGENDKPDSRGGDADTKGSASEGKPNEDAPKLTPEQFARDLKKLGFSDEDIKELGGLVNSDNPEDQRTARLLQAGIDQESARDIAKQGEQETADVIDLINSPGTSGGDSSKIREILEKATGKFAPPKPPTMPDAATQGGPRGKLEPIQRKPKSPS